MGPERRRRFSNEVTERAAVDLGVNFFDVTHDSEKEALWRNLTEMPPPYPVYVQTRGELMNYSYDPGNRKMTNLGLLRAEVQRILKLMRRERLELLNLGILRDALDDSDFIAKIAANVKALQKEGLILFAAADTFSGRETYKAMMASGAFATLNINFNVADDYPEREVFPFARKLNLLGALGAAAVAPFWLRSRRSTTRGASTAGRASMTWARPCGWRWASRRPTWTRGDEETSRGRTAGQRP